MKHHLSLISIFAAFLAVSVFPMQASADALDDLLEEVRTGTLQKSDQATQREQQFGSSADQAGMVAALQAERATLEARSEALENQFAANDEGLNTLRAQKETALGDLKELFAGLQQVVGEAQANFDTSIISAQFPGRSEAFEAISVKLSQSNELPTAAEIESIWSNILNEMVQQGKVVSFNAPVATASGSKQDQVVTRVGVFNLVGDGKFLTYGTGGIAELPRQPDGQYLGSVSDLQSAAPGSAVSFFVDPTRGTLLGANVERPSLAERVTQGGTVGYVIIAMGAIALAIAIWRLLVLFSVAGAVKKQAKNAGSPSPKNPLGRVLQVLKDNPNSSTESLELKLTEQIMKETPKLNKMLMFLKIVAVVAPLMGLLGTVTGMIETFQSITLFGAGDPKLMAGGISQALVTTVLGLCVAIPTVLMHTLASSKAKQVQDVLEEQSAGMVARQIEA
ncbi:MAG: energy transducer TonB [Proteobacteria bacterium]|jgi:biopolymer transport protein ExbB|nr:energy transducer TonB [Pseudomonadota bacterium]